MTNLSIDFHGLGNQIHKYHLIHLLERSFSVVRYFFWDEPRFKSVTISISESALTACKQLQRKKDHGLVQSLQTTLSLEEAGSRRQAKLIDKLSQNQSPVVFRAAWTHSKKTVFSHEVCFPSIT